VRHLRSPGSLGLGNYIVLDNVRASRELTPHLLALGHPRIGLITGLRGSSTAADRLRAPEGPAVVGFDDVQIAAHREIQLTTMAQQKTEMGRLATSWILEIIRNSGRFARTPLQVLLTPTLIVRRTYGALGLSPRSTKRR